jgi:hypothetical protein
MKPKINETISLKRFGRCIVIAVHSFGTIDIKTPSGKCYRVSGLSFN